MRVPASPPAGSHFTGSRRNGSAAPCAPRPANVLYVYTEARMDPAALSALNFEFFTLNLVEATPLSHHRGAPLPAAPSQPHRSRHDLRIMQNYQTNSLFQITTV